MKKCIAAVAAVVGVVFASDAGKLGEGITAYYPFSKTSSGAAITGYQWDASSESLVSNSELGFTPSGGYIGSNGNNPIFGSGNYVLSGAGASCHVNQVDAQYAFPTNNGDWAVSLWAKRDGVTVIPCLYYHGNDYADSAMTTATTGNAGMGIYLTSAGEVYVGFSMIVPNGTSYTFHSITSSSSFTWSDTLAAWHNIVVNRKGATVTLWVDGTNQGSCTVDATANLVMTGNLSLCKASAMFMQNGTDDLCFWARALNEAEISDICAKNSSNNATPITELYSNTYLEVDCGSAYTATEVNALGDAQSITLSFDDGATFTIDTALEKSISIFVNGSMTITAGADYTPTVDDMAKIDASGVSGALYRTWLTPGVVGFNFNAAGARNGSRDGTDCNETGLALEIGDWYYDAYAPSGSSTNLFSDGLTKLTWVANNVYTESDSCTGSFIKGYLDDGGNVTIKMTAVPYEEYDVIIYCSTDNSEKGFKAKTVNGKIYTWDSTTSTTIETNDASVVWGSASAAAGKAVYGANTIRVNGLTGPLSILGGTNGNNGRGCISAIQIMPAGTSTAPTLTAGAEGASTSVTWSDSSNWNTTSIPTSGPVVFNVTGDVTVTVDAVAALGTVTVNGTGSLRFATSGATFSIDTVNTEVPVIIADAGVSMGVVYGPLTYEYAVSGMTSSSYGNTYTGGAGSVDGATTNAVALALVGGTVNIGPSTSATPYYIEDGYYSTWTTVTFTNATAVYTNGLSLGHAEYVFAGDSTVTLVPKTGTKPRSLYLSDGANSRTATLTLKDSASLVSLGNNNVDSNQGAVLFGHYNGTSVFTMRDSASFSTLGEVLVSKTSGSNTINISGGTFTAQGIKVSAGAGGTQALNFSGGELVLGDIGISAYGSYTMPVNVTNTPAITATAETLPISQPLSVAADSTLAIATTAEYTEVVLTGEFSGDGYVSLGDGVTLAGTGRPRLSALGAGIKATATDADLSAGKVQFQTSLAEVPSGAVFAVYDGEAATQVGTVTIADGVLTIPFEPVNPVISTTTNVSDLAADLSGAVTVIGSDAENVITFNFDAALPEGVTSVTIRGSVNICGTIPWDVVTFADNAVIITTDDQSISNTVSTVSYIVRGGTLKLFPLYVSNAWQNPTLVTVETAGTLDICGYANKSYPITLAGGTLTNSGSDVGAGAMQFWNMVLTADSYLDITNEVGSIASGYGALTYTLNGHKLTKKGTGTYHISNATFAGGGTIEVLEGTMHLQKTFTVAADTTLNLVIGENGTLTVEDSVTKSGTLNLTNNGMLNMLMNGSLPSFDSRTGDGTVLVRNGWAGTQLLFENYVSQNGKFISNGNYGWTILGNPGVYNCEVELKDNGTTPALKIVDGSQNRYYVYKKLSGDGSYVIDVTSSSWRTQAAFMFNDATNFSGNISTDSKPIYFTTSTSEDRTTSGTITIQPGVGVTVAAGKIWQAASTITVNGDIGGSGTLKGSTVSFGNGITFTYDGNPMTITTTGTNGKPVFGKRLYVKGDLKPNDYLFIVGSKPETLPKITLVDDNGNPTGALWTKYVTVDSVNYIQAYSPGMTISIR